LPNRDSQKRVVLFLLGNRRLGAVAGCRPDRLLGRLLQPLRPGCRRYIADVVGPGLRTEAYGTKRLVNNASFALGVPLGALQRSPRGSARASPTGRS